MAPSSGFFARLRARLSPLVPRTPATVAWLATTLLETAVDTLIVGLTLNVYAEKLWRTVLERDESSVLPVYLGLFVLAHVTQLVLAVDALVAKNTIQVVALAILNGLLAVYAGVQIAEIRSLVSGYLAVLIWVIPAMISLTELVYLACLWPIWREFGWQIFKTLGADRRVKKSYAWFQVLICVLKFDLFFFIAFSLQLVFLVPTQTSAERWITVAALPVTSGMLLLGFLAVKHENRTGFWCFLLFIIYRDRETDYRLVFKSLTIFAALCLAALLLTTATVTVCYRHFGRGLKYHMSRGDLLRSESVLELKPTVARDPADPKAALEEGGAAERYDDDLASSSAMPYAGRNRFRMSMD
ncbi:hypothetical protein DMC30DRAFT_413491 [Rhodotorula diobovata]|uniref:Uncharacterized protein n=1 Tax=Rhodotorula diobovata TaxID=5288 RepID=A0A5C5G8N6_9BASI|nr:hypothetical protein DMC30DRAFT_413491 [Rhodotorula diobovata]